MQLEKGKLGAHAGPRLDVLVGLSPGDWRSTSSDSHNTVESAAPRLVTESTPRSISAKSARSIESADEVHRAVERQ
jgi:hypothetical protein